MHYGGHLREAFLDWVEEGCPAAVSVEVNYEPRVIDAGTFLRRMARCSDILGQAACEDIEDAFPGIFDPGCAERSFGSVARWLLKHRLVDVSHDESANEALVPSGGPPKGRDDEGTGLSPPRREAPTGSSSRLGVAPSRGYRADRGGHAPGHLRDAFIAWVEAAAQGRDDWSPTATLGDGEEERPIGWLIGQLWDCTDVLPGSTVTDLAWLGIEVGPAGSYAAAARAVAREL